MIEPIKSTDALAPGPVLCAITSNRHHDEPQCDGRPTINVSRPNPPPSALAGVDKLAPAGASSTGQPTVDGAGTKSAATDPESSRDGHNGARSRGRQRRPVIPENVL